MTAYTQFITKQDLEQLLPYKFGSSFQLDSFTVVPLTNPGENYGSNILAVDVVRKDDKQKLYLVVKLVPVSSFLREFFQCGLTVRKEMDMYLLVSPEYEIIQKENNIPNNELLDIFPVCYGARATKEEDVGQPADEGSAIVLENLKISGYECGDRVEGFDLDHTKYILKQLARFHATAVAIKLKKPEVFAKTVKKACAHIRIIPALSWNTDNSFLESSIAFLKRFEGGEKYTERITKMMKDLESSDELKEVPIPSEPFATISHNDLWTNNMMVTYGTSPDQTVPAGFKIVDYQVTTYDSPVKDLIFFLYTSTKLGLIEKHYDEFIRQYHDSFIRWLEALGCDVKAFSYEAFLKEVETFAPQELPHIFFMLRPIHLKKEMASNPQNFDNKVLVSTDESTVSKLFLPKLKYFLDDFSRKGWM